MKIVFTDEIRTAAPQLKVIAITADVINGPTDDALWGELNSAAEDIRSRYNMPDINKRPGIAATRAAYKALGKDPNRYRPSAEALCRRMVKGMDLYRTLSVVDMINLVSVKSGYSIGGFDLNRISGEELVLGVGREGEDFEAIGRGQLNISGLPVYRDSIGGIGTPTSDNERTKLSPDTRKLLMLINIYDEEMTAEDVISLTTRLLNEYCGADNIKVVFRDNY